MSCYNPSFIQRFINPITGEVTTKFLGSVKNCVECNQALKDKYTGFSGSRDNLNWSNGLKVLDFIMIPCGKCIGCRIDYSRSWADRMTYHSFGKEECSYFITVTYDDDHIQDLDYSKNYDLYSLNPVDFTKFIKDLRNKFRDAQIDYYYSMEYGDSSFRPHGHFILYNLFIPDLQFWKLDNEGQPIYTSEIIHSLWKKGICSISSFAWLNAAYTASYVEKKRDGRANCEYTAVGLVPEGCRMSRRPGISYDYYIDHYEDLWKNNGLDVSRSVNSSGHLGIPRYFRKLAEEKGIGRKEFVEWRDRVQEQSLLNNEFKLYNSSFDDNRIIDFLRFQEREILSRKKNKSL